jgi:DNA-binding protein HU-beta
MNKGDLINKIAENADLNKAQATEALNAMLNAISNSLTDGEKVTLVGFGTFLPEYRKPRNGRNPKTMQNVPIEEKVIVKFKPGKDLADAVDNKELANKFRRV